MAVITHTCGTLRLAERESIASCSMLQLVLLVDDHEAQLSEPHLLDDARVPTTMPAMDCASSGACRFALAPRDPVSSVTRGSYPGRPAHRPAPADAARRGGNGRRGPRAPRRARGARRPTSTACNMARSATTVAPVPTSPCTSRFTGCRPARSAAISSSCLAAARTAAWRRTHSKRTRPAGRPQHHRGLVGAARARAAPPSPRPTPTGDGRRRCRSRSRGTWLDAPQRARQGLPSRTDDGSDSAISSMRSSTCRPIARSPRAELAGGRVHRDEGMDLVVLVERLELRVGELQLAVEHPDLAGEHRPHPGLSPATSTGWPLRTCSRARRFSLRMTTASSLPLRRAHVPRGLLHLRDDRDVLADLQPRDVGEPPAIDVVVVAQQIARRVQRQLRLQRIGGAVTECLDQRCAEIDAHSTPNTSG